MRTPLTMLERMLRHAHAGAEIHRTELLSAWSEARRAHAGRPEENWWRWISEAGASLGMRLRPADVRASELLAATQNGSLAAHWRPSGDATDPGGEWLVIAGWRGSKALVVDGETGHSERWLSKRRLLRELGLEGKHARARCVLTPPEQLIVPESPHLGRKKCPVQRLVQLLKPEWNDLYVVLVFAVFVGLMTLATPIAVEALVNTVAFGRMLQPVFVLALLLFTFLGFGAALRGVQFFVVEILQRRLFVRLASDLALRLPRVREEGLDRSHPPELVNRFLDVVTLQKVTAQMLLDGLQLTLGTLIGMALLAVYHPWLLGFDIFLLLLFAAAVFLLGKGAVPTSVRESKYKYQVTAWLQELARCRNTFRLSGGAEFAADHADHVVTHYLDARQKHFRIVWRQIVFALFIYVMASTVLLGLGGWLVIAGQLTLGQLVAAELIVTVIVGSFAKMGKHFEAFYDLAAAVDKLGVLLDLPLERQNGILTLPGVCIGGAAVKFVRVKCKPEWAETGLNDFHLQIRSGERVAVADHTGCAAGLVADLLFGLREPSGGSVLLDDINLSDMRPDRLRSMVALLRSPEVFEGTIGQNLGFDRPEWNSADLREALARFGLGETLLALPESLNTRLATDGKPLTPVQTRLLMLARAVLRQPRLLVIDGLLDSLPDAVLGEAVAALFEALPETTIVAMSGRRDVQSHFERVVHLDSHVAHPPHVDSSMLVNAPNNGLNDGG